MARRRQDPKDTLFIILILGLVIIGGFRLDVPSEKGVIVTCLFAFLSAAIVLAIMFYQLSKKRTALRKLTLTNIDSMPGIEFERWVGEQLRIRGYRIHFTPAHDYGVDIIATKENLKTAVQVKRYKNTIGLAAVQEAIAGMAIYKCSASMVITNSSFTIGSRKLALANNCELIDRDQLAQWFSKV